jgi:hypothetical protein
MPVGTAGIHRIIHGGTMRDYEKLFESGNGAQREKLEVHKLKGCWKKLTLRELMLLLFEEVIELHDEYYDIEKISFENIRNEAADVANYAHMIIQKCDEEIGK